MKALTQKNTLLKNAQVITEAFFLREYFFSSPRKIVFKKFPTLQKNKNTPIHSPTNTVTGHTAIQ